MAQNDGTYTPPPGLRLTPCYLSFTPSSLKLRVSGVFFSTRCAPSSQCVLLLLSRLTTALVPGSGFHWAF